MTITLLLVRRRNILQPSFFACGPASVHAVSFANRGEPSNVYLDPHYLTPQQSALLESVGVVTVDAHGHNMVKGYHAINLGDGFVFSFVPVNPGQAPHLVSDREFERNKSQTLAEVVPATLADKLPPSTFASQSSSDGSYALDGHALETQVFDDLQGDIVVAFYEQYL